MRKTDRRRFLRESGRLGLGAALLGTGLPQAGLFGRVSLSDGLPQEPAAGFGPLAEDPKKILDLPEGFSYRIISRAGVRMKDGFYVPGIFDGMGAFAGPDGKAIIVRNHEIQAGFLPRRGPFGADNELLERAPRNLVYDRGGGIDPALGSVTTLLYDLRTGATEREALTLAGTLFNCSGGVTPWNTWLSCEETFQNPNPRFDKRHGYVFEVPASADPKLVKPVPLKAMGRFVHEAAAVDPGSGIIYMTEDQPDSLIYRYIPDTPGKLQQGGRLQALAAAGRPGLDTRNWKLRTVRPGDSFETEWIDLDDVDPKKDDLRVRGHGKGAALFGSGEGMVFDDGIVYFDCTNGGPAIAGQVWKYFPGPKEGTAAEKGSPGRLELFVEVPNVQVINHPDQMTMTPWGDLFICEDGKGVQHLVGVTPLGGVYRFARNAKDESEFTGVCFSPDGRTMFVNFQEAGLTFAVTGPWSAQTMG
jgi:secreted PhoX family phosphatase